MTGATKGPKRPGPRQAENDKFHNYKVCGGCGKTKRLVDFSYSSNWRKKRAADPKRYKPDCRECSRAHNAVETDPHFNPVRVTRPRIKKPTKKQKRDAAAKYKRGKRRATRIKVLEYIAAKGCCDCGTRDPRVLEFDHMDPDGKDYDIARLLSSGYGWASEKLRAEIRKCRVICANCHRKHTIVQQGNYAHRDVVDALQRIYERFDIRK
jgi:hypothetical protein